MSLHPGPRSYHWQRPLGGLVVGGCRLLLATPRCIVHCYSRPQCVHYRLINFRNDQFQPKGYFSLTLSVFFRKQSMFNNILIYYHPQRSWEGYVFTGLCLSTRGLDRDPLDRDPGSASVYAGIPHTHTHTHTHPGSRHPPGADTPQSRHPLEQTPQSKHLRSRPPGSRHPPWADTSPGADPPSRHPSPLGADTPLEQTPPPEADNPPENGHCCGRYASYWNAFLLTIKGQIFTLNLFIELFVVSHTLQVFYFFTTRSFCTNALKCEETHLRKCYP